MSGTASRFVVLKRTLLCFEFGKELSISNGVKRFEGIRELETLAVIDAINTGGKHRSTCPRQPPEFAVTDDNEQGLDKTLGWYK